VTAFNPNISARIGARLDLWRSATSQLHGSELTLKLPLIITGKRETVWVEH
jgi:hypothetical protein